jgi:hypothetical protein
MRVKLYAPENYWVLPLPIKSKLCNGCGSKGFGWTVPDKIYGLCITEACNIHDFMYNTGKTAEDKAVADMTFLNNMLRIIEACTTNQLLKWIRGSRAYGYYLAVKIFGGPAFWNCKNLIETFRYVDLG